MTGTPTRRLLLTGLTGAAMTPALPAAAAAPTGPQAAAPLLAYVGSRTTKARNARGLGITVWRVPPTGTGWELLQVIEASNGEPGTDPGRIPINPSFLALDRQGSFLYAVHGDATQVSAFSVDQDTGQLSLVNTVDTGRRNPVHLSVDPSGRWLVVAHLAPPGSVTSLSIRADGSLGDVTAALELPGTPGPHKTQQLGPNPHHAPFDPSGRWIVVPDRGLDRLFVAALDAGTGALRLNEPGWTATRELEGPRHVAFHPSRPLAYVVNELRSTVTTYRWDAHAGTLTPLQVVASTPPAMTGDSRAAEIVVSPSGRYVYASNRSGAGDSTPGGPDPDTIGVFQVDGRTGLLQPVRWVSTQGIRPRFFGLDPFGRLYAANEVSDTIVGYAAESDRLRTLGVAARTGSPVCIVFRAVPSKSS